MQCTLLRSKWESNAIVVLTSISIIATSFADVSSRRLFLPIPGWVYENAVLHLLILHDADDISIKHEKKAIVGADSNLDSSSSSSSSGNTNTMANGSPARLTDWLQSVGIWWDESLVNIRGGCSNCSGPALGVFAVSDIQENQLLCIIPRSAILSPRTTQLAQILEAEKLGGGLALTIAVMYEASLERASKWFGYFASLPAREYLPMFWSDDELQLLQGTALHGVIEDDRRDTEEDYQQHVVQLMAKHPQAFPHPELCSLQHFRIAASWVASRSFHVDSWHGDAMVPLADIFNHKASLVLLQDGWQVAEELDRRHHHHGANSEEGDPASDSDESQSQNSEGGESDHSGEPESSSGKGSGSGSEQEDTDHESGELETEGSDDADPQHGFAVGGMELIPAAGASTAAAAGGGIVHKAAGSWVRDGINLRLEIGICSMGPPDTTLADMTVAAVAQKSAADTHSHDHNHSDTCGCGHDTAAAGVGVGDVKKRTAADESEQQQQQQQKKQKTDCETDFQQQQQQQQRFPDKRLEIVAASPVAAGAEVHNTYGELSNQALVHKYGFCLPANPFDEVQLGPNWSWLLTDVLNRAGLKQHLKQHVVWLQKHSDLLTQGSEGDEVEEPPTVLPGGRVPKLVAAVVRLLGLPASKLKTLDNLQDLILDLDQQQQHDQPGQQQNQGKCADVAKDKEMAEHNACTTPTAAAAEAAMADHFDDVTIPSRDVSWWGRDGLIVLHHAVQQRLQQYPGGGFSIEEDEQTLSDLRSPLKQKQQQQHNNEQVQQQHNTKSKQKMKNQEKQSSKNGNELGPVNDGEHIAAVTAALQLRVCEQRILQQALDAVKQVLGEELSEVA